MGISSISKSGLNFNQFTNKVEKHISDVKKNKGYLSKGVSGELRAKQQDSASFFASNNVKALSNFTALSTAFGYNKKARFINGVNQAKETNKAINQAVKDGEEMKVRMDELVKQFEAAKEASVNSGEDEGAGSDSDANSKE